MATVSRPDSVKAKIANECLAKERCTSILFIRWLMRELRVDRIESCCIGVPEIKDQQRRESIPEE